MCCNSTYQLETKLSENDLENDMAEVEFIVIDIDLLLGGVAHPVEDDLTKVREVDQVVPVGGCFRLKCHHYNHFSTECNVVLYARCTFTHFLLLVADKFLLDTLSLSPPLIIFTGCSGYSDSLGR